MGSRIFVGQDEIPDVIVVVGVVVVHLREQRPACGRTSLANHGAEGYSLGDPQYFDGTIEPFECECDFRVVETTAMQGEY